MPLSSLTYFGGDIAERSAATPGLWNRRFSILSQNLDEINSQATTTSASTEAVVSLISSQVPSLITSGVNNLVPSIVSSAISSDLNASRGTFGDLYVASTASLSQLSGTTILAKKRLLVTQNTGVGNIEAIGFEYTSNNDTANPTGFTSSSSKQIDTLLQGNVGHSFKVLGNQYQISVGGSNQTPGSPAFRGPTGVGLFFGPDSNSYGLGASDFTVFYGIAGSGSTITFDAPVSIGTLTALNKFEPPALLSHITTTNLNVQSLASINALKLQQLQTISGGLVFDIDASELSSFASISATTLFGLKRVIVNQNTVSGDLEGFQFAYTANNDNTNFTGLVSNDSTMLKARIRGADALSITSLDAGIMQLQFAGGNSSHDTPSIRGANGYGIFFRGGGLGICQDSGSARTLALFGDSAGLGSGITFYERFGGDGSTATFHLNKVATSPPTGDESGQVGDIRATVNSGETYLLVCISANSWFRVALDPF